MDKTDPVLVVLERVVAEAADNGNSLEPGGWLHAAHAAIKSEITTLRAEVREWLCEACNTVYPGPPKQGFNCVVCPKCCGTTGPRGMMERRALERRIAAPDPVVEANRKLLLDRSRVGVEKYGTTLAATGLSQAQIVRHALEETLDLANYLQTILMQGDAQ